MSIKNIFDKFFYLEEVDEEQGAPAVAAHVAPTSAPRQEQPKQSIVNNRVKKDRKMQPRNEVVVPNNVVSLQAASSLKNSKVILIEPRVYAEAQDIAEHLKNKRATIVNLQRIDRDQGVRIIDFLSGTVYALGGDIQRIGTDIFLCTPDNVEVSGEISDYLYEEL
ncbi:cell division protein SepF [Solibacillus sp. FSL H8-0538]|uniref:cell division protein SepF n=1 Tax=Solibacillus sp. FSL H8-0538 TaxID=2921400 RepID=UPI0030FB3A7D